MKSQEQMKRMECKPEKAEERIEKRGQIFRPTPPNGKTRLISAQTSGAVHPPATVETPESNRQALDLIATRRRLIGRHGSGFSLRRRTRLGLATALICCSASADAQSLCFDNAGLPEELQHRTVQGEVFDAYRSNAKRYDTFDAFLVAQKELETGSRQPLNDLERYEKELVRTGAALAPLRRTFDARMEAYWTALGDHDAIGGSPPNESDILALIDRNRARDDAAEKVVSAARAAHRARERLCAEAKSWNTARNGYAVTDRALARIGSDFLGNIFLNEDYHRPAHIREVRLESRLGDVYNGKLEPDDLTKEMEAVLEAAHGLIEEHEEVARLITQSRPTLLDRMAAIENEWQSMNDGTHSQVVRQLVVEGAMEGGDVAATARAAGPAAPAVVIWEGLYRGIDLPLWMFGLKQFDRKIDFPKISDELIEIRLALANEEATHDPARGRVQGAIDDFKHAGEQAASRIAGTVPGDLTEQAVAEIFEMAREWKSAQRVAEFAARTDLWGMVSYLSGKAQRNAGGPTLQQLVSGDLSPIEADMRIYRGLVTADAKTLKETVTSRLNKKFAGKLGVDALKDLAVSAGKNLVLSHMDRSRLETERNMAIKEIEYLALRNSARGMFRELLRIQHVMRETEKGFGLYRHEIAGQCCKRVLERDEDTGAVEAALEDDYDEDDTLTLFVTFDKAVRAPEFAIGDGGFAPLTEPQELADGAVVWRSTVPILALDGEGETLPLTVRVGGNRPYRKSLDGDARTVPILDGIATRSRITGWTGFEETSDTLHQLPVLSPETGFYLAVADIFNPVGLGVQAAGGLGISVLNGDGEVVAAGLTGDTLEPVFMKVKPGNYTVKLELGSYLPVYDQTCGRIYERAIEVPKSEKPGFTAIVRSAEADAAGSGLGIASGECIALKK